jgi:hypothetical protein
MENNDTISSDLEPTEVAPAYWQRVVANVIDWVIEVGLMVMIYFLLPQAVWYNILQESTFARYFVFLGVIFLYRCICLLLLNRTIGMAACRIKYLNGDLQPLSLKEKCIAIFAVRTPKIKYYKAG